jgi:hypothetical protein
MSPEETKAAGQEAGEEARRYELPYRLKLSKPIPGENGMIEELVFEKEPLAKDWIGFSIQTCDPFSFVRVASNMLNIPLVYLKKLSTRDTFRVQEVVASFLD